MFKKDGIVNCRSCSATLRVKSDFSGMLVCDKCYTVNVKQGLISETVTFIPEDMSLIRIGTLGKIDNKEFEIIGRYKVDEDSGYYNLWVLHYKKDDTLAWLIDSFGEYVLAMQVKINPEEFDDKMWNSHCGFKFPVAALGDYRLLGRTQSIMTYIEGELPDMPQQPQNARVLELLKDAGKKLLLIKNGDSVITLAGDEREWEDFHFTNVRKFPALAI